MGKVLKYVILLSSLSIIIEAQLQKEPAPYNYNDKEKEENFTLSSQNTDSKDHNDILIKRVGESVPPFGFQGKRKPYSSKPPGRSKQIYRTLGLQAYLSKDSPYKSRRNPPLEPWRNGYTDSWKKHPYSRNFTLGKNLGNGQRITRPTYQLKSNNSVNYKNEDLDKDNRRYHHGRSARFNHFKHSPKICDSCNSVPWVPIFKVPDTYRQQRTHLHDISKPTHQQELPKPANHDFSFDYKAFASDTHNILLPPSPPILPLIPPLEPIIDGTISSSFGLPIGNIPSGHGLLAPINPLATKINKYGANHFENSNPVSFLPTQSLLDTNPIPELSPVPIVPIHESTQFYQFDSSIPSLTPPTAKPVDVSNIVLTISEGESDYKHPNPMNIQSILGKDLNSASSSLVDFQSYSQGEEYPPLQNQNFGRFEIIKSIPLVEFTSTVNYPGPALQLPSLTPPVQFQYTGDTYNTPTRTKHNNQDEAVYTSSNTFHQSNKQKQNFFNERPYNYHAKVSNYTKTRITQSSNQNFTNLNFLVPPPVKSGKSESEANSSKSGVVPFLNPPKNTDSQFEESVKSSTIPLPLTSPSLSWLFSEHTIQSTTSKSTQPASHQFFTEAREIASVVNNELRPVSPYSFPSFPSSSSNSDTTKSKKIQIIIPYTTKHKNESDNNALESVHREVFQTIQPPVILSTHGNNSSRDFAISALPPNKDHPHLSEANRDRKVIDITQNPLNKDTKNENYRESHKYLTEMQHIIASNIRELLKEEIQKSHTDQNYSLQNNIDNWTALEYSNHKTVGPKAPREILNQASAVTSIPGTSISHLLLPSKKIPNEYFVTTPLPVFDEPDTPIYRPTNSSVDSKPFTAKPYASTSLYYPTRNYRESTPSNHEKNYTEVARGKVNHWGRLNENLVLPEARTKKIESSTVSSWSNRFFVDEKEKVQIVTPVSLSSHTQNFTTQTYRRTTREVHTTEKQSTTTTELPSVKLKPSNYTYFFKLNSTKLEKMPNETSPFNKRPFFRLVNSTQRQSYIDRVLNKTEVVNRNQSVNNQSLVMSFPKNITSEELIKLSKGQLSINDIFPFRNKELPWEMNLNNTHIQFWNGRQRKSLIKQKKVYKPKPTIKDYS